MNAQTFRDQHALLEHIEEHDLTYAGRHVVLLVPAADTCSGAI